MKYYRQSLPGVRERGVFPEPNTCDMQDWGEELPEPEEVETVDEFAYLWSCPACGRDNTETYRDECYTCAHCDGCFDVIQIEWGAQ